MRSAAWKLFPAYQERALLVVLQCTMMHSIANVHLAVMRAFPNLGVCVCYSVHTI